MLVVECSGTPQEIGFQHGNASRPHIHRCIRFYNGLFQRTSRLDWPEVRDLAHGFETTVKTRWPDYYDEMTGIAQGAGVSISDILALNVRTEIAFGKFSDGCTALAWNTGKHAFLAQNWDWNPEQKQNLIILKVNSPPESTKPSIWMVTEAGIIGKIGLNSAGVGVCLNAIRAEGMDPTRLPVHLGLRTVLDSSSAKEAVDRLQEAGIAASAHILIADASDAYGCEYTAGTSAILRPDEKHRIIHTNHLLLDHGPDVVDTAWLEDSPFRVARMNELSSGNDPSWVELSGLFQDRKNAPTAICRNGEFETLFNIVMDLKLKRAAVILGRPDAPEDTNELSF